MSTKGPVTFQALQLANEQRNAYGMRVNDFTRYRKHCANRTHRLRSSLKTTHGKGREFKKLPPLTNDNIEDGHLQLLLYEAERAWASSQDLSAQASKPSNTDRVGTLRHNATGRFRRAVNWSTQLLSHCQALHAASRISTADLLQATIYTLILNGRFLRYRFDFEDALIQLSVARHLLDELADRAVTSRDQALATLYADEIGPEIRYCAHELGRAKAYDIDGLVAELSAKHGEEIVDGCGGLIEKFKQEGAATEKVEARKNLAALEWEGQPVPVRNPELVDVLFRVQEAESKLAAPRQQESKGEAEVTEEGKKKARQGKGHGSKRGVAAFDAILLALSDAEDVARKLVETQQLSGGSTSTSAAGTRDIHFVHAYIVYQLLSRRIQRDLLLISTLLSSQHSQTSSSPASHKCSKASTGKPITKSKIKLGKEQVDSRLYPAIVKILDTILQSLTQMRDLSIVDETPDLASAVDARLTFTKAQRCLYLSHCYVIVKKYAESLTLIQHANIHLRETRSTLSIAGSDPITSGKPAYYSLSDAKLDESERVLAGDGLAFKNEWLAYNGGSVGGESKTYKKPLFFDIALNYAQLDMDQLQRRAGKAPVPAPAAVVTPSPAEVEKKQSRLEEIERALTPEPQATPARGGLSTLLGGWWGRK